MTDALTYFATKLTHETDASDVYAARTDASGPILVDVRSLDAWEQGHATGAIHLPYADIAVRAQALIPHDADVVVYCWSPGCNAGARAGVEFAQLGYRVREMIGGYEYWRREGYPCVAASGPLPRIFDPLVTLRRSEQG